MAAPVAVLRTSPETVVADYGRLLRLVKYEQLLPRDQELILKLNLSWTKYFPACSSQPWQVEGVVRTLLEDGYERRRLFPVENRTVVTDPVRGARNNRWTPILERAGLPFIPLTEVEWITYQFRSPLLRLNDIFPDGIQIPKMYVGRNVLHLPTVKCVHPDTDVLLADGSLVRAEALVKEWQSRAPSRDLPDGERVAEGRVGVVSLGSAGLRPDITTHVWRTPLTDPQVWTVRTRTGRQVTVSGRHPFLLPEGWKPAQELRVGDRIAVAGRVRVPGRSQPLPAVARPGPDAADVAGRGGRSWRRFPVQTQRRIVGAYLAGLSIATIRSRLHCRREAIASLLASQGIPIRGRGVWATAPRRTSPGFWRWVGYFVAAGEAGAGRRALRVGLTCPDPAIRGDYVRLCRGLFGVRPRCSGSSSSFHAVNLGPFFECLGVVPPTVASATSLPDLLFRCPRAEIAAFVQAYVDADGAVRQDGVHVTTRSGRLASQLQMLLARLGVLSFVRRRVGRPTRAGRPAGESFSVSIQGADVARFAEHVRFRCRPKQAKFERLIAPRRAARRPARSETIPVPPALLWTVRERLGITLAPSGRPGSVGGRGSRPTEATRREIKAFIRRCSTRDVDRQLEQELQCLRLLATEDIAWDRVERVQASAADVPFFYDLSLRDTRSFVGNGIVLHNTHGHSTTTGAIKNSFGGLLKEVRHYAHEFMHEVLVDLMLMQRELHPSILAVMDGTVMGDGAGPRTMLPRVGNLILASADQVAIDAIAAKIMGFDPLGIPYLRMCHERGLGVADPRQIEIVGDADLAALDLGFKTRRSLVIWGDQLIRRGPLRPLKRLLLHSPLVVWAPFASNVYHDVFWYPTVGAARIREFSRTPWGRLFETY